MIIPVVIGVSFVVFSIVYFTPGNPAESILGAGATQEAIENLNHDLGYDQPFIVQYGNWFIKAVTKLDFGRSWMSNQNVAEQVFSKLPISIMISFIGMLGAAFIGVPIGVLSAVKQYSIQDTMFVVISIFLAAMPVFWFGMLLMLLFANKLHWLPTSGLGTWKHLILPCLTLAIPYAAQELRYTRSMMLDTIRQDYIRTAKAKGAPKRRIIWKHALGNAMMPVVTVTGLNFGALIGGAVLIESLFNIPGVGNYMISYAKLKDVPAVLGSAVVLSAVYCLVILLMDLLYAAIDPRVKARYMRGVKKA